MVVRKHVRWMWGALALAALAMPVSATTLKVDGPGDGDGDTVDDFDSITAALVSLGAAGIDGTPDVINVVVDKINAHPGILINGSAVNAPGGAPPFVFPPLTDDLTINGDADANGSPCVLVLGAGTGGTAVANSYSFITARFAIEVAAAQSITVRNLTLIPAYVGSNTFTNSAASDGGTRMNCLYVDEAGTGTGNLSGANVTLDGIIVTGADSANNPVPTGSAPPVDATYWASDASFVALVTFVSNNAGLNTFNFNMSNSIVAHGGPFASGIGIYADGNDAAAASGVVTFTNVRASFNGNARGTFAGEARSGFTYSGSNGTASVYNACTATFNGNGTSGTTGNGIGGSISTAAAHKITINGGNYSNNFGNGILFNTAEVTAGAPSDIIDLNGVPNSPVLIQNNLGRGVQFGSTANSDLLIDRVRGLIVTGNGGNGIEFNEVQNLAYDPPGPDPNITIRSCLVANNRNNIRVGESNASPATLTFADMTFHNPGNLTPAPGTVPDAHVVFNFGGTDLITSNFVDCIFSGGDATDRLLVVGDQDGTFTDDGDNNAFVFTNCAIVQAGPYTMETAINQLFLNGTNPAGANGNTVNGIGLDVLAALPPGSLTVNPNYASTTPGGFTSDFLDVRNAWSAPFGYANFPNLKNNLSGGANFLGYFPDATVTPTPGTPFPQELTFFDNPLDDSIYTPTGELTLNITSFAGSLPLIWDAQNPESDPSTVAAISAEHYALEYWSISHNAGTFDVVADMTLRWPDAPGFPANPADFPNLRIHRFNGTNWVAQVAGGTTVNGAADPNVITAFAIPRFSPFSIVNNATLSVDLLDFSAAQTGSTVTVNWSTSVELDNAGFAVYRSNDGSLGEKLSGLIPAEGSSIAGATYSFVDPTPISAGETSRSYLLVDIDLSGSETVHGPATATITTGAPSSVETWSLY